MSDGGVRLIIVDDQDLQKFQEENIRGAVLVQNAFLSATLGVVAAGEAQRHHYQNRPEGGIELIFIYSGHVEIRTAGSSTVKVDIKEKGPVLAVVPSGSPASIHNVEGGGEARFFSVFVPPFAMGEIVYLE